jgi:hypothetical protein
MQHHGFTVETAKLNHALNKLTPDINKHNCSFYASGTRPTPLTDGTGQSVAITGVGTVSFG